MSQNVSPSTLERYDDWLAHPVTVALNRFLRNQRQELMERWSSGHFTAETSEGTAQLNAKALGEMEAIQQFIDLSPEQFLQEQTK